jgi:hypothetical protein
MESHVREYFPEECSKLTAAEVRKTIRDGMAKARRHGFSDDADVCRFIDISVVLGAGFDVDPELSWAAALLNDPQLTEPGIRMDMLFEAACAYLRQQPEPAPVVLEFAGGER